MDTTKLKDKLNGKLKPKQSKPVEVNTQEEGTVSTMENATVNTVAESMALMPVASNYVALTSDALGIISENLKNQQLSTALFDVVKSPSGGTTAFTVPGLSGDEIEKELTGIILDYTTPRAYWDTPDPVEGTPPVCYSNNSTVSFEGQPCSQCQYNDFGSKNGGETNAKACKESVCIFLLRQDNILPLVVRVPVSSKMLFMKYATRLVSSLTPICGVTTKITLEKATNKTGQPYAKFNFEAVNTLSQEETATARAFGQKFMEIMNTADIQPVSVIAEAV